MGRTSVGKEMSGRTDEGEMLKIQTCGVNLKKITIELLAVLHFEDFKIRHRYFHWIKVILSGQD